MIEQKQSWMEMSRRNLKLYWKMETGRSLRSDWNWPCWSCTVKF